MCSSRQAIENCTSIHRSTHSYIHPSIPSFHLLGLIHGWSPASVPRGLAETSPSSAKSHLAPQIDCGIHEKGPPTKIPAFGSVCLGEIDFLMLHIGRELSEFGCSKTYWLWAWRIGVDWWYREHDWLGLVESILEISVDFGILERFWSRSEFLASFRCMRVREGVADARGPPSS